MFYKKLIFISFIFLTSTVSAQILVQKLPNENLCEIDFNLLQQGYQLAYSNMSSEDYLFKGKEEEWKSYWIKLMHNLNNYMQENGLKLSKSMTCFNRIYFNKNGNITAYLYQLKGLTAKQEQKFDEAIFQFLISQKVAINASQNYWQYGTLRFE